MGGGERWEGEGEAGGQGLTAKSAGIASSATTKSVNVVSPLKVVVQGGVLLPANQTASAYDYRDTSQSARSRLSPNEVFFRCCHPNSVIIVQVERASERARAMRCGYCW